MKKNMFKWTGIYLISAIFLCLNIYATPVVTKNLNSGTLINPAQADTSMHMKGTHQNSSTHMKKMNKKSDSTSVMHRKSTMTDTSKTHKKKKMSTHTSMMRSPKSESNFISGMTRYLNRRVKLNSDQVDKVHQFLTDYFAVARTDKNNVNNTSGSLQTGKNERIYAGTHNPVDTNSYISPYASLNHSEGTTNSYGAITSSGSDTSANQSAGAKSKSEIDSTNQNNRAGAMENTTKQGISSNSSGMNSISAMGGDKSTELDQSGMKLEKQIESILTDHQRTKFASFRDNYINLVREQALTVKSE